MGVRILKHKWEPAVHDLYANQIVWVYEDQQDTNQAYLCEMRSGPRAGLFYWFKESEFLPVSESKIGINSESESS